MPGEVAGGQMWLVQISKGGAPEAFVDCSGSGAVEGVRAQVCGS